MAAPRVGPCSPWATEVDLCEPCGEYAGPDAGLLDEFLVISSEFLYQFSGQQFPGPCEETVRPCTARTAFTYAGSSWHEVNLYRRAYPYVLTCTCGVPDNCGCGNVPTVRLGRTPIASVETVKINGTELAESAYRVDDYEFLVRLDGDNWPCCQDLSKASTQDDTFEVTFTWGHEVPASGKKAAAVLACELFRACNPDAFQGECRLPRNVIQVARQGVTVLVQSIFDLLVPRPGTYIRTGLVEVDMFLAAYNPWGNTTPSIVLSPDVPAEAKRVGT